MKRVLVLLSDGTEEIEAVSVIDTLRRASFEVVACFVPSRTNTGPSIPCLARCSRGVNIICDGNWDDTNKSSFDAIVLPGGKDGADNFLSFPPLSKTLKSFHLEKKLICAICASPLVLERNGLLKGKRATCYPSLRDELKSAEWTDEPVVTDGNIVTSQGPATAIRFALEIIARLDCRDKMQEVARDMLAE